MLENRMHFSQPDLQIMHFSGADIKKMVNKRGTSNYMLYVIKGRPIAKCNSNIKYMNDGQILISNKNEEFTIDCNNKYCEIICIWFHQSVLTDLDENYDLLKPFKSKSLLKIYNEKSENTILNLAISNMLLALRRRNSRIFILSALLQALCEINTLYENKNFSAVKETDSNFAKIINYIDNHIFEKLTLKKISDNIFLSEKCISNTIKRINNQTFLELIVELRCTQAKILLVEKNYPLIEVAKLCGFETYSTFYRTYKKYYGITPIQERKKQKTIAD